MLVLAVVLIVALGREDHCEPRASLDDADQFVDMTIGWKVDLPITGLATLIWSKSSPPYDRGEDAVILDIPEGVVMTDVRVERGHVQPGQPEYVIGIFLEDGSKLVIDPAGHRWDRDSRSRAGAIALDRIQASIRTLCPGQP